jgi:hypothetical protein
MSHPGPSTGIDDSSLPFTGRRRSGIAGGIMGVMRAEPDDKPALPAKSSDETGIGWGEAPEPDDDERLCGERPPHWDS